MEKTRLENNRGALGWFKDKWSHNALFSTIFALVVMVLIQCVVMWVNAGSFGGMFGKMGMAWLNILRNNAYQGVIALGMCFIIISGGIDLSVGSMLCALGAILMYLIAPTGLLASIGLTGPVAYVIAVILILIVGYFFGEINGALISYGKLPPFIATLGTMKVFRSVTQQLTKQFNPEIPADFKLIASAKVGGQVVLPILYWVVIVVIMHIIFTRTAFGRQTIAIGSNERAAKLSGINVNNVKRRIYALGGVMCAIAAVIYIARIGSMDFANAGNGYEMDAIAAVIVGGTSMSGGRGSLVGAFLGMLIIGVMNNILNTVGVPTFLCDAVKGLIIIFAVLLQKKESA
ncbi:MAG TPA: ABC transporter permease [Candidatus Limivicinus faecipullorum]|nr:ABC transporter permease [Candidatus Limivicinus faecipullorum]